MRGMLQKLSTPKNTGLAENIISNVLYFSGIVIFFAG